eukprot:TRINITY_DN5002_c0_g1_i1.p1 TRINITY_DN5002_c0_g1~~TRINITY_DN5002_c0_g1_i1.p1  ORF type:complete len:319 (+),score=126.26 TRINITY_DN5002_c0_g1_i1:116-1072(+)
MKIAVVTGAAGYVATWVIKKLVDHGGYTIRGTVRSAANSQELKKAFPSIELYDADLLKDGSFDEVVKGATVIFHTASPYTYDVTDPQKELVDPAVQGTLNVLRSADKSPSVKRVVLTSSAAAVHHSVPDGYVFSEKDWNISSTLETDAYSLSKTLAEKAAWDHVKGKHYDLVTTNPAIVLGPVLTSRADGTSIQQAVSMLKGGYTESGVPPINYGIIDVRDLGELHVLLAERPEASGRHLLCSPEGISYLKLAELLRASGKYTKYSLPTKESAPVTLHPKYDTSKVNTNYIAKFIPIEKTIVDMADSLIAFGLVPKKD